MKKIYILPESDIHYYRLKYSVLDHSETVPGEEGDEFNAKQREDTADEEHVFWEIENKGKGLW